MMNVRDLQELLEREIEEIRALILTNMPSKGNVEDDCQRLCLLNRLNDFAHTVNGIEAEDLLGGDVQSPAAYRRLRGAQQRSALALLDLAIRQSTESGLFDEMLSDMPSQDTINDFCDAVSDFKESCETGAGDVPGPR